MTQVLQTLRFLDRIGPPVPKSTCFLDRIGRPEPEKKQNTTYFEATTVGPAGGPAAGGVGRWEGVWGSLPSVNVGFSSVFAIATIDVPQIASLHGQA